MPVELAPKIALFVSLAATLVSARFFYTRIFGDDE